MRMGKPNKKRRSRVKPPPDAKPPQFSSPNMVVGQVSSNVVASILWPQIEDRVTESLEWYADLMVEYDDEVRTLRAEAEAEAEAATTAEKGDEGDEEVEEVEVHPDGSTSAPEGGGAVHTSSDIPLPPLPGQNMVFRTQQHLDDLIDLVLQPTSDHFSKSNEWKVHANAAKFERLLDERYGPLRPFVDRYPQIERTIRNVQRKYAKGHFSPLRQGDPPLNKSTSVVLLFMMHRNKVRWEALLLAATFLLVGLQPWALVVIVAVGQHRLTARKRRRVGGMAEGVVTTKAYYRSSESDSAQKNGVDAIVGDAESEKKRRGALLLQPVGTKITPSDFVKPEPEGEETYDTIILGSGPASLYTAALLARTGRTVLVLSPTEDASGCIAPPEERGDAAGTCWDNVPFDVQPSHVSHITKQQRLLAPALCTDTDVQGGIRFVKVGTEADGYAHDILSIPGMGTVDSGPDGGTAVPFVLRAGGISTIAEDAATYLGDGWPGEDGAVGHSSSAAYVKACEAVNATASNYYTAKLLSDSAGAFQSTSTYQEASIRYASGYLNKLLPLNAHVRSLMAGIGMRGENLRPGMASMAAHVTNVAAACSVEGMAYPVGGPRALCGALETVITQCGGKVLTGVAVKEFVFEDEDEDEKKGDDGAEEAPKKKKVADNKAKKDDDDKDKEEKDRPPAPQCIGISLADGRTVTVPHDDGAVISMLGFIPTFVHLLPPAVRNTHGVPRGLPALSERRPLLKVLVGLRGTAEDLAITGADWYRLPNASIARDEIDAATGQVKLAEIGMGSGGPDDDSNEEDGAEKEDDAVDKKEIDDTGTAEEKKTGARGKRSKHAKKPRRKKFDTGSSWMKVSFPSAKDPSWNDRHEGISTCVVTIEADDDFVTKFDSKPVVYSNHKVGSGDATRLMERVMKDLVDNFPQLEGKIEFSSLSGPSRAGLSHNPERYAAKGVRPATLYPGLYVGGSDLTVGDSFSGSMVGGWLAANAVMDYTLVDHLFLGKNITTDLEQFMKEPRKEKGQVEDVAVLYTPKQVTDDKIAEKKSAEQEATAAESSKEK